MLHTISIDNPEAKYKALEVLRGGGTLVYPTETCYGLGCSALNTEAVEQIFNIKVRAKDKPVLVIAHDVATLMKYVEWNEEIEELARTYWPGPLTIVAPIRNDGSSVLAKGVIGENDTVAFRVTSHPFAASLVKELGGPIVSTSANIASYANPYDIDYIVEMFEGREYTPDLIIDAGNLPHHSPSTIVQVGADGTRTILRQGEIILGN